MYRVFDFSRALPLLAGLLLAACGGGGGGGGGTTPTPPTPDPWVVAAQQAKLSSSYRPDLQQLTLSWSDAFTAETGFRIDRLSGSDWVAVQQLPASAGTGTSVSWTVPVTADTTVRVVALNGSAITELRTNSQATQLAVAVPATAPAIALNAPQPLLGNVDLTVTGAPAGASVRWYTDFTALGGTLTVAPFTQTWASSGASAGAHLVQALVQLSADQQIELRRSVTVGNTSPVPGLQASMSSAATVDTLTVDVRISQTDVGVASTQLFVDEKSVGLLTLPNICFQGNACPPISFPAWGYRYTLPLADYSNGTHALRAVVTDNNGAKLQLSASVEMNAGPKITLARPADNEILSAGKLQVTGSVTDDTGEANVTIKLDDVELRRLGSGSFDFSYDLTGVASGGHALTISARDKQGVVGEVRRVVRVQLSAAPVELVTSLQDDVSIAAAEGGAVLLASPAGARVLRGSADAGLTTVLLSRSDRNGDSAGWRMSGGRAIVARAGDDTALANNVYLWNQDGSRRNLVQESGISETYQHPAWLDGDWAAWGPGLSTVQRLVLMNVATQQLFSVPRPADAVRLNPDELALIAKGGSALLSFSAQNGGTTAQDATYSIYLYDSATQTTQRLSPAGARDSGPQTDGQRLAWNRTAPGETSAPYAVYAVSLSKPTELKLISSSAQGYTLKDGLISWQEKTQTTNQLKADDGTSTTLITNKLTATLVATGGGGVAWAADGKLNLWMPAGGSRQVLDFVPNTVVLSKGWLYFTSGNSKPALQRMAF